MPVQMLVLLFGIAGRPPETPVSRVLRAGKFGFVHKDGG
jgi:hypothetical protein